MLTPYDVDRLHKLALAVIDTETQAVAQLTQRIDAAFLQACDYILHCSARVVVLGMGKSGHIGGKIAATLASTGSPAFFVHPGEASHGDLGMITVDDVVLAISNSGETEEILRILPLIKRLGVPLISFTGNPQSTLAQAANANVDVSVAQEACPLGLAPTASTTAALVMGDALAIALLEAKGFSAEDFAFSHPGGSLGRRLLLHVSDIMHTDTAIPCISQQANLSEALLEMTRKGLGITVIVSENNTVLGVFTDGDLRRTLENQNLNIHETPISRVMTAPCQTIQANSLAVDALSLMQQGKINALPVVDNVNQLVGALNMHDLLRAKVI